MGGRGRGLAQYWQGVPNAKLVAVADLAPHLLDVAHATLGDVQCYPDHRSMLEQANLDVVTVGTTGQYHAAIVHDAVAQGVRGIYVEKPFACCLADADAMIADCKSAGTVLAVGHQRRWMDQILPIRDAIRNGAIGRVTHGYVYWATGRLGSNGTHFFDAINFMLDSEPIEVVGRVTRGLDVTRVDDHPRFRTLLTNDPGGMGFITYANGARIAVDCMNDVLLPYTYIFCGTRGRIELEEVAYGVDYRARDEDTRSINAAFGSPQRRDFPPLAPYVPGKAEQAGYRELLHCIETGARPASSGEDGRLALEMIVAFHLSSDAGMRPVALPLDESAHNYQLTIH
jgi:predicted dehydrogenase